MTATTTPSAAPSEIPQADGSAYNPKAFTPAEHASNCAFQLSNVKGWLWAHKIGNPHALSCAQAKANSLIDSACQLLASLDAELRSQVAPGVSLFAPEAAGTPASTTPAGSPKDS